MLCQSSPYPRIARCVFRNSIGTSSLNNELRKMRFPICSLVKSDKDVEFLSQGVLEAAYNAKHPWGFWGFFSPGRKAFSTAPSPLAPVTLSSDPLRYSTLLRYRWREGSLAIPPYEWKGVMNPWIAQGWGVRMCLLGLGGGLQSTIVTLVVRKCVKKGSVTTKANNDISRMISAEWYQK